MQFDVTVQIEGEDVLAGRLYQNVRHGDETATFSYATSPVGADRPVQTAYPRRPSTSWQTVSMPVFAS